MRGCFFPQRHVCHLLDKQSKISVRDFPFLKRALVRGKQNVEHFRDRMKILKTVHKNLIKTKIFLSNINRSAFNLDSLLKIYIYTVYILMLNIINYRETEPNAEAFFLH